MRKSYSEKKEYTKFLQSKYKKDADEMLEWFAMAYGALVELLELKHIKETEGKSEDYLERQPKAWYAANQVIELWRKSDYGAKINLK